MEWTPNELADALRNWIGNKDQLLAAANMIQDQAQEIELLKKTDNFLSIRVINLSQEITQLKQDAKDCTCQGGHSESYLKAKGRKITND
jgi:hypothetical protein